MKNYTTILITIVLVLSFVSTAAIAQFGGGAQGAGKNISRGQARGGGAVGTMGLMSLDLTEDQRFRIQNIMQAHQEEMLVDCDATREDMNAIKAELAALLDNEGGYPEDDARRLLYEKFNLNTEKQIRSKAFHYQILWEVLDADQRAALKNQRENAAAFNSGMRQGSQGRMNRAGAAGIYPIQ